jgi:hypothetical protein
MDPIRRNILAAVAFLLRGPQLRLPPQHRTCLPSTLTKEERPHPLPGGGLRVSAAGHLRWGVNSRISNWTTAVIKAIEEFKNDFRCITMDQRNATGGESTGRSRSMTRGALSPKISWG